MIRERFTIKDFSKFEKNIDFSTRVDYLSRVKFNDLKTSVPESARSASVAEMSVEIPAWLDPYLKAAARETGMSVPEFIASALGDEKDWRGFVNGRKAAR